MGPSPMHQALRISPPPHAAHTFSHASGTAYCKHGTGQSVQCVDKNSGQQQGLRKPDFYPIPPLPLFHPFPFCPHAPYPYTLCSSTPAPPYMPYRPLR